MVVNMRVRIQSRLGRERVEVPESGTVADLRAIIEKVFSIPTEKQFLSLQPNSQEDEFKTPSALLGNIGIHDGSLVFLEFPEDSLASDVASASSSSIASSSAAVPSNRKAPRNILELQALRAKRRIYPMLQPYEARNVAFVGIDRQTRANFISYVGMKNFQAARVAYLFGSENEWNGIDVHAHWEPPQTNAGPLGFEELSDAESDFETVDVVAKLLDMECVGWMFSQTEVRDETVVLSAVEVFEMAKRQRKFGSKFVTLVCPVFEVDGKRGMKCEAWQVSNQLIDPQQNPHPSEDGLSLLDEMVPSEDGKVFLLKNPEKRFSYNTEWRNSEITTSDEEHESCDPTIFLCPLPLVLGKGKFVANFTVENREIAEQRPEQIQMLFDKYYSHPMLYRMRDFHLLIYLVNILGLEEMVHVISAVKDGDRELLADSMKAVESYAEYAAREARKAAVPNAGAAVPTPGLVDPSFGDFPVEDDSIPSFEDDEFQRGPDETEDEYLLRLQFSAWNAL